jgi:hypothetical protein
MAPVRTAADFTDLKLAGGQMIESKDSLKIKEDHGFTEN